MAGGSPVLMLSKRNQEKYGGKWVAAQGWNRINMILASGDSISILKDRMRGKGYYNAVIFYVDEYESKRDQ